jgi:DNA repair and recombination protein RAD52
MPRPPRAYSDEEASHIQQHLDLKLDSSHLSYRPAGQGTVAYLEGWKAFTLANEVFGFNGWSSEILSLTTDFVKKRGRVSK